MKKKDAARVRSALQCGADPNSVCTFTTPCATYKSAPVLIRAVVNGDIEVVKALLEADNINVELHGDCPNSPLLTAILKDYVDIAGLLLSRGANPDLPSGQVIHHLGQHTPLLAAAERNSVGVAELLLSHGASPDLPSGIHDCPPLVQAAHKGHLELCRLLLQHNANPDATDKFGAHGIFRAAGKGHREVVELIVEHGGDPTIKYFDRTPAEWARSRRHTALADWLDKIMVCYRSLKNTEKLW